MLLLSLSSLSIAFSETYKYVLIVDIIIINTLKQLSQFQLFVD